MLSKETTLEVVNVMAEMFPEAHCELTYRNPFELVIAVSLSAQATDVSVNKVTPGLFEKYPTPEAFVQAPLADIMDAIKTIGLYRNKAKNIKACSEMLIEKFGGDVPR
ncbi:endonuclease III domain-containing protein, partial [Vagococcus salmoninarum]|uniref:endonuclease III domain-containing protein n=1 Tax=Vagococcus salmoninarum TaxID=2739 RepID=UPI003F98F7F3